MFSLDYSDPREESTLAEFLPLGVKMDVKIATEDENDYKDESGMKVHKWN